MGVPSKKLSEHSKDSRKDLAFKVSEEPMTKSDMRLPSYGTKAKTLKELPLHERMQAKFEKK